MNLWSEYAQLNRIVAGLVLIAILVLLGLNALWSEWPFVLIPIAVSPMAFVGALLIARVPRNGVGWLLAASGLAFAASFAGNSYAWVALVREGGRLPGGELAGAVAAGLFTPALSFAVLMLLFFPSGRGLGGRWTWVERFFVVFVAVLIGANFLKDVPIEIPVDNGRSIVFPNPFAAHGLLGQIMTTLGHLGDSWSVPLILVGPISLFARYRRSDGIERHQIKWLAYAGTLSLAFIVTSNLTGGDLSNWLWVTGACLLGLLPIAIAVAIFRYRLYDIDVLIRRTVIYAAVSAMLLATYVAVVALLEFILAPVTAGSGVAVAISTLAVVALFQPLRQRIQSSFDRRFYRRRYDAVRTLDTFAVRLRDEIDLDSIRAELVYAVYESVQPDYASIWLREAEL